MINSNTYWQAQRRLARRTALIAGAVALIFYSGFMLLGILGQ